MSRAPNGFLQRRKHLAILLAGGLIVVAACIFARGLIGEPQVDAKPAPAANRQATPRPEHPPHDVMAVVNGKDINRQQLAHACVERFGEEVLESLVNKRLILHHCNNRNIRVTQDDINAEIDRMAERFKLGREQWLQLLEKERGINPQEYARDIIWPTLALQKLAANQLTVSDAELARMHEMLYGEAIRARLLVVSDRQKAGELRRQLVERPEEFARLAMNYSEDVNSASIGGLIQPIRRHMGDPAIERAVFALSAGAISDIIPVAQQFAILKCEGRVPPQDVALESVRDELEDRIKDEKLRDVAGGLFADLQKSATIQNVWNDDQLRQQMPGIVAVVNGDQITMKQLGDECLLRYGQEVLEVEISHVLLQQALTESGIQVTQKDIDREVTHAAQLSGVLDDQGHPDLNAWFELATKEQGLTRDMYLRDTVWPSAALKRLVGDDVNVTPDDLQKGFAANYGPRVRCRAIVLHNMRKAMEVWGKARQNPSLEYFGDLAAEYSIEATSKSLRGEVPPIRQHGGQPQLEKVAFALQPGELSEVVQVGNRFIILKCEGRTEPIDFRPEEVREVLHQDIYEKKIRMAMSERYEQIRAAARIDNYLAGTSQAPQKTVDASAGPESRRIDTAVRPTSGNSAR